MASTLFVLCPNGRRQIVKVSPNASVLEVLEQACKKQGLKPDDFDIKHYEKPLDLSLSVRFANLPNNAMLELSPIKTARHECLITVALQLESGERFTDDFPPSATMWDVINKCFKNNSELGLHSDVVPMCIYMRQKFIGEELKMTTLRSVGLTGGKAIIRLLYRPVESFNEQAHVSSPLCRPPPCKMFKEDHHSIESPSDISCTESSTDDPMKPVWQGVELCTTPDERSLEHDPNQSTAEDNASVALNNPMPIKNEEIEPIKFSDAQISKKTLVKEESGSTSDEDMEEQMDSENFQKHDQQPQIEIGEIIYLGPRNAVLFNLSDILAVKSEDLPEEFFELTISDVQYLYNDSIRIRKEMENEPLLLKSQRQARMLQHLSRYEQSVIRIYFPDQLVLQGTFRVCETIQSVMDFVRSFLQNQNIDFNLYITPPKQVLIPKKTLLELHLVPAAVVHFGCNTLYPYYLREEFRKQVSDPRAATQAAVQLRKKLECKNNPEMPLANISSPGEEKNGLPMTAQTLQADNYPRSNSSENRINATAKVPTWFKLGNK